MESQLHNLTCQVAALKENVSRGAGSDEAILKLLRDNRADTTDKIQTVTANVESVRELIK